MIFVVVTILYCYMVIKKYDKFSRILPLFIYFIFSFLILMISYSYSYYNNNSLIKTNTIQEEKLHIVPMNNNISLLDIEDNYLYFYKNTNGALEKDTISKSIVHKIYYGEYEYSYIKKVTFKKSYSNNIIKTLFFPFFIDNYMFNYYFEIYLPKDFKISMGS